MTRFAFPAFPNGWFQVAYADELPPGGVLPLHYFGRDLVAFRGEDGTPSVLDAHCAHLGAHLGVGGKVVANTIECPFHAWRFDARGACVAVSYARKIPPKACQRAWPICEKNGLLMVYHHAGGKPPEYESPDLPEHQSDQWSDYERLRWTIRSHNQDMAENNVDRAHFRYVHGTLTVPELHVEEDGEILRVVSRSKLATRRGPVDGTVTMIMHGFGFGITRFAGILDTLLIGCTTPIDGEHVDVRFSIRVKKVDGAGHSHGIGKAIITNIEDQMNQDKVIWENKAFLPRPVLCDGDGPIRLLRRWSQQFYTYPTGTMPDAS